MVSLLFVNFIMLAILNIKISVAHCIMPSFFNPFGSNCQVQNIFTDIIPSIFNPSNFKPNSIPTNNNYHIPSACETNYEDYDYNNSCFYFILYLYHIINLFYCDLFYLAMIFLKKH